MSQLRDFTMALAMHADLILLGILTVTLVAIVVARTIRQARKKRRELKKAAQELKKAREDAKPSHPPPDVT